MVLCGWIARRVQEDWSPCKPIHRNSIGTVPFSKITLPEKRPSVANIPSSLPNSASSPVQNRGLRLCNRGGMICGSFLCVLVTALRGHVTLAIEVAPGFNNEKRSCKVSEYDRALLDLDPFNGSHRARDLPSNEN